MPEPNSSRSKTTPQSNRVTSVDALRGFDMMWIVGGEGLVFALHQMTPNAVTTTLATQLDHAEWAGFHFYDLIFPLFVFIMGVSIVFSLTKAREHGTRAEAFKRVARRFVLMFVLAIIYYGGFSKTWPDIRIMGVLQRIALCYVFGSILFLLCKPRTIAAIAIGLLLGYWAIMALVPIRDIHLSKETLAELAESQGKPHLAQTILESKNPSTVKNSPVMAFAREAYDSTTNHVRGKFEPGYNLANHLDFLYLPGKKWDNFYDPEGYLSTLPAVVTCLLGVFGGLLVRSLRFREQQKVWILIGGGILAIGLGWLWGLKFPVIKKIWTSSYVLIAGGWSAILLGTFYQIVDVWKFQRWSQPFVWIGMNSITIYVTEALIGSFEPIASRLAGGDVNNFLDTHVAQGFGELLVALVALGLAFWFCGFLYRRGIFIRL